MPGVGIGISPFLGGTFGYSQEAQAYFDRVTLEGGSLTGSEKGYINTFINTIGISEFDRLWVHGLSDRVAARISLANPTTATIITEINATTWTAYQGYSGDGLTQCLNTNYNPAVDAVKYTLNNCCGFAYSRLSVSAKAQTLLGNFDGTNLGITIYPRSHVGTNDILSYSNSDSANYLQSDTSDTSTIGFYFANRTTSTASFIYKNGVLKTSPTPISSTSIPNYNMYLLGTNNSGILYNAFDGQISLSGFGSGNVNQATFYTAVQTLGTQLGWAV